MQDWAHHLLVWLWYNLANKVMYAPGIPCSRRSLNNDSCSILSNAFLKFKLAIQKLRSHSNDFSSKSFNFGWKEFAVPRLKREMSRKSKQFHYKWVDEIKRGAYCSRFTCVNIKVQVHARRTRGGNQHLCTNTVRRVPRFARIDVFAKRVGTQGQVTSGAFTSECRREYQPHFQAWLQQQSPEVQAKFEGVD